MMSLRSVAVLRTAQRFRCGAAAAQQKPHFAPSAACTEVQRRHVHQSAALLKTVPKNLSGRSKTAQDWLTRQLNDPYVHKARRLNYRARSAFKLLELQERHNLLRPGAVVVECGASPGAWTQVAVRACNPRNSPNYDPKLAAGVVVGVDLQVVTPVPGSTIIHGDFTLPDTQKKILEALHPHKPDVVLSDMAPSATGTKDLDHECIMRLAYTAAHFAKQHAAPGSSFVCKVWAGGRVDHFTEQLAQLYQHVKVTKPPCSRTNSAEVFVIAKKLKGGVQRSENQAVHGKQQDHCEGEATADKNSIKGPVLKPSLH